MSEYSNILVIQTAFIGDVILTLPMIQALKERFPDAGIDVVIVPRSAGVLENHPAIRSLIIYNKKGEDAGFSGLSRMALRLRRNHYDLAVIPHRSLRSAILAWRASIPKRIGFDTSAGRFLFHHSVQYDKSAHEILRNLRLLTPLKIEKTELILPDLYPSDSDRGVVEEILRRHNFFDKPIVAIAPGTVWMTKQWLPERFELLAEKLVGEGNNVILIGGKEDEVLCNNIAQAVNSKQIISIAGALTLLQSAALVGRANVLVSNDSAPMHLAVAMRTPVIAMFGATVPEFGFAPVGEKAIVIQTEGLTCRPCSIHGGDKCPIETFDCMKMISVEQVYEQVKRFL